MTLEPDTVHFKPPRKQRKRVTSVMSVNLTPAIDITFNLLIFFLVTTTFETPEGLLNAQVPTDQGVLQQSSLPISPIKVRIKQIGEAADDYRLQIEHFRRTPSSFSELTTLLIDIQSMAGFDAETPVVIMAQEDVKWDHVVNAFNAIRRARYGNISFAANSNN